MGKVHREEISEKQLVTDATDCNRSVFLWAWSSSRRYQR